MSKYTTVTLDEVESTNGYALEHIRFFDDKTVIYTAHQTSGHGRYNRKWIYDDSENIYMTIVLKPQKANYPFANLTQYLSVIVSEVLENEYNIKASVKWPNDILVNGAKISGILAESYTEGGKISAICLGLGLNVNLKQETLDGIDQKAVSMSSLKGKNYNTNDVLNKICEAFFKEYDDFSNLGFPFFKDRYISRCDFLGKNITVKEGRNAKKYFAKYIDDDGLLAVKDEFNNDSKIITGDVLC